MSALCQLPVTFSVIFDNLRQSPLTFCYLCNENRRILCFFCIILRRLFYGTRKSLSATAFTLHMEGIWVDFTNHLPHLGKNYARCFCAILPMPLSPPLCVPSDAHNPLPIFTIFGPISPTVFSQFLIDLRACLRYNIFIKFSNSSTHPLKLEQTGGNHHESQCQTRIHGPHHQF